MHTRVFYYYAILKTKIQLPLILTSQALSLMNTFTGLKVVNETAWPSTYSAFALFVRLEENLLLRIPKK